MTDKARFRAFQRQRGLDHPAYVVGRSAEEIMPELERVPAPLLFKPTDTSGSRGMSRVERVESEAVHAAFAHACRFSRAGEVCVESFLSGVDLSGDGFLQDGRIVLLVLTEKHTRRMVPTGHRIPCGLDNAERERVCRAVAATCEALGYRDGPFDFDARLSPDRVTLLEISPRLGGNSIPVLIAHGSEFDPFDAALSFAVGERTELSVRGEVSRPCGAHLFGAGQAGRLARLADEETMRRAVPRIWGYTVKHAVGDAVRAFRHSGDSLGWVHFDCDSSTEYRDTVARIENALSLEVEPA
jgi:biotin carboxylase